MNSKQSPKITFAALVLVASGLSAAPIVVNGDFSNGFSNWTEFGPTPGQVVENSKTLLIFGIPVVGPSGATQLVDIPSPGLYRIRFSLDFTDLDSIENPQGFNFNASLNGITLYSRQGANLFGLPDAFDSTVNLPSASQIPLTFTHSGGSVFSQIRVDDVSIELVPQPAQPVPGPAPILGALGALAWSRKLRGRIRRARSGFDTDGRRGYAS